MKEIIEIDGSEGGGQILRTALSLSILTCQPFIINNIRKSRPNPGLQPQHLESVKSAQIISNAKVEGAFLNSKELKFYPSKIQSGDYEFKIKTAGSISLLFQSIYLPLTFAKGISTITIEGGTHVPWSPTFNYLEDCWLWFLKKIGINIHLELIRAGFYPQGGGCAKIKIYPANKINPLQIIDRGNFLKLKIYSAHTNLKDEVAHRQTFAAKNLLQKKFPSIPIDTLTTSLVSYSHNTIIAIIAYFENTVICYTELGKKGKPAEKVAESACTKLINFFNTDATVDEYMADQLLLPLSLSYNPSVYISPAITNHIKTNIDTIRKFLKVNFEIQGNKIRIIPTDQHFPERLEK